MKIIISDFTDGNNPIEIGSINVEHYSTPTFESAARRWLKNHGYRFPEMKSVRYHLDRYNDYPYYLTRIAGDWY